MLSEEQIKELIKAYKIARDKSSYEQKFSLKDCFDSKIFALEEVLKG